MSNADDLEQRFRRTVADFALVGDWESVEDWTEHANDFRRALEQAEERLAKLSRAERFIDRFTMLDIDTRCLSDDDKAEADEMDYKQHVEQLRSGLPL
jgi:hypothetical protein